MAEAVLCSKPPQDAASPMMKRVEGGCVAGSGLGGGRWWEGPGREQGNRAVGS